MSGLLDRWCNQALAGLSDEEVLLLARAGNRTALEHLLDRYRAFVERKARAYYVRGADHDDVVQEGMLGLLKAVRDFRSNRFVRFRVFAEICITRQILSAVKAATRQKHLPLNHCVSLDRPTDDESQLIDLIAEPAEPEWEESALASRLREYLERDSHQDLTELEYRVIQSRLEGKSYQQVAGELQCCRKRIDNALQRAKRKIWNRIATDRKQAA